MFWFNTKEPFRKERLSFKLVMEKGEIKDEAKITFILWMWIAKLQEVKQLLMVTLLVYSRLGS